jgi:hypothetical protein
MHVCPQCGRSVDPSLFSAGRDTCVQCGSNLRSQDERAWIDVARVSNLAEAGFLADELIGLDIDAQVHQQQNFSALDDRWTTHYLIRVPAAEAQSAAAQIRQYLAEDSEREVEYRPHRYASQCESLDPILWRPVALVILAGVSSFVLGQRFSEQNDVKADRRGSRNSLSTVLESIDRPFVTAPARGKPAHRLSFDRHRQKWLLETDRDADGRFDSRQAFHASGAAW